MTVKNNTPPMTLASRGSLLAMWQAHYVANLLQGRGHSVTIRTWKTTGDIVQDRFLHEIGGKGLFIKELEEAMKRGDADFAVHSLKDLPARISDGFCLAAVLKRHQPADVLIFNKTFHAKAGLKPKTMITPELLRTLGPLTVATSSLRRGALLAGSCPDIRCVPVRGNVDTRLKKLETEPWHAIILAEASLERLGIENAHTHRLDPTWFVPCAGQGALAVETRANSHALVAIKPLECRATRQAVNIERSVLARLGGDCTMPFGCHVGEDHLDAGVIHGRAVVLSPNGDAATAFHSIRTPVENIESAMEEALVDQLRKNGANTILTTLGLKIRI
jgi:hydroxymethylbilane synthase